MKMTHDELKAALLGARFMDLSLPQYRLEQNMADSYEIADSGVYYLPADDRGLPNLGAVMFENVRQRATLRIDALEKAMKSPGYFAAACRVLQ